jgi:hypothetical protein
VCKERGDSVNTAAFQAILSDVVSGVVVDGWCCDGLAALVKSTPPFFQAGGGNSI